MERVLWTYRQSEGPSQREALETWLDRNPSPNPILLAEIQLARGLAAAVDLDVTNPALWRQYRDAVRLIRESFDVHHDDNGLGDLVSPAVRDEANA